MNVVIMGQEWLAAKVLEAVVGEGHTVLRALSPSNGDQLALTAKRLGVPLGFYGERVEEKDIPEGTEVILVAQTATFVPRNVRIRAAHGALGYHPSLLPRHRGIDAMHWAIHMREPVTGGTVFWMDDNLDTGDIAAQQWCHIRPEDTPKTLWERDLEPMGVRLFAEVLRAMEQGQTVRIPQDPVLATWEPGVRKRGKTIAGKP